MGYEEESYYLPSWGAEREEIAPVGYFSKGARLQGRFVVEVLGVGY